MLRLSETLTTDAEPNQETNSLVTFVAKFYLTNTTFPLMNRVNLPANW